MANDGTGANWDVASPANADPVKDGAREIRDVRIGTAERISKEHVDFATAGVGGEHLAGSAKVYFAAAASTPTKRPDTTTNLGVDDKGRVWFISDTLELKVWTGAAFSSVKVNAVLDGHVSTAQLADGAVTTSKLADHSVTVAKIASDSVGSVEIIDNSILTANIANDQITTTLLDATLKFAVTNRIKNGSYTGNNTTTKAITGLGFQPDALLIADRTTGKVALVTASFATDILSVTDSSWLGAASITLDAGGFTLKTADARVNAVHTYVYVALKSNS